MVAAMKEHEHRIVNLEIDKNNFKTKIKSNTKDNETNKNIRILIR